MLEKEIEKRKRRNKYFLTDIIINIKIKKIYYFTQINIYII